MSDAGADLSGGRERDSSLNPSPRSDASNSDVDSVLPIRLDVDAATPSPSPSAAAASTSDVDSVNPATLPVATSSHRSASPKRPRAEPLSPVSTLYGRTSPPPSSSESSSSPSRTTSRSPPGARPFLPSSSPDSQPSSSSSQPRDHPNQPPATSKSRRRSEKRAALKVAAAAAKPHEEHRDPIFAHAMSRKRTCCSTSLNPTTSCWKLVQKRMKGFRRLQKRLAVLTMKSAWFDRVVLCVIFANTVVMLLEKPNTTPPIGFVFADNFFAAVYIFEMLIKMFALGIKNFGRGYFAYLWNWLDFFVIIGVVIGYFDVQGGDGIVVVRLLRVLRTLKTVSVVPKVRSRPFRCPITPHPLLTRFTTRQQPPTHPPTHPH